MVKILERISKSQQILIKQIAAETNALVENHGAKLISLSQGVPNLPILESARVAMNELIDSRKLPYTDVGGLKKVRERAAAFINKFYQLRERKGFEIKGTENIIITAGAAQAVYNALALSIESRSDVVVSPLPAYGLYKHQTEMLGGTFDVIEATSETNFIPTISQLRNIFNKHTNLDEKGNEVLCIRSIVLCYPNNPTGACLDTKQAKEIASFLDEMLLKFGDPGFSVILDEVYFGIMQQPFDKYESILMHSSTRLLNNTFLILSASKGLGAMPGARTGICCSFNSKLINNMIKVQQACSANASIISQEGLYSSLNHIIENPSFIIETSNYYNQRVSYVCDRLNDIGKRYFRGKLIARKPQATFYVFADFSSMESFKTDIEIQRYFRDRYKSPPKYIGVAVVPGSAFGLSPNEKFIRFSCAVEMDQLEIAMDVIESAIADQFKTTSKL